MDKYPKYTSQMFPTGGGFFPNNTLEENRICDKIQNICISKDDPIEVDESNPANDLPKMIQKGEATVMDLDSHTKPQSSLIEISTTGSVKQTFISALQQRLLQKLEQEKKLAKEQSRPKYRKCYRAVGTTVAERLLKQFPKIEYDD